MMLINERRQKAQKAQQAQKEWEVGGSPTLIPVSSLRPHAVPPMPTMHACMHAGFSHAQLSSAKR